MKINFSKMHGLGNDFVVIDATQQPLVLDPAQAKAMADRHRGIGCDQILIVESATNPQADFRYRIINADGSEVAQCGNGARCFAQFVRARGLSKKNPIVVETTAGLMTLTLEEQHNQVAVEVNVPDFQPKSIPLSADEQQLHYYVKLNDETIQFMAVSVGNPHAVIIVDDIQKTPVAKVGAKLECHNMFPEKANIGFMQIIDQHHIALRVFERGVGETQACGSGACAAVVTGIIAGALQTPVDVKLAGGTLTIDWAGPDMPVFMRGSASHVFDGTIDLATLIQ